MRRRRGRRPISAKKKAAALFRVWHGVRQLIVEAERQRFFPLSWPRLALAERARELHKAVAA